MPSTTDQKREDSALIEKLAAIEHERWADWQRWCNKVLRENNPSHEQGDVLERWDRQIETPYAELSEKEKQSDRDQVMRYWPLIKARDAQREVEIRREERQAFRQLWGNLGIQLGASAGSATGAIVRNDFGEEWDFQLDREALHNLFGYLNSNLLTPPLSKSTGEEDAANN